jgi:hypothetical protein
MICSVCACYAFAEVLLHGLRSLIFPVSHPRPDLHFEMHLRQIFHALAMLLRHTNKIESIFALLSVNLRRAF